MQLSSDSSAWLENTLQQLDNQTDLASTIKPKKQWLSPDLKITELNIFKKFVYTIFSIFPKLRDRIFKIDRADFYNKFERIREKIFEDIDTLDTKKTEQRCQRFNDLIDAYENMCTRKERRSVEVKFKISAHTLLDKARKIKREEQLSGPHIHIERVIKIDDHTYQLTEVDGSAVNYEKNELENIMRGRHPNRQFALCIETKLEGNALKIEQLSIFNADDIKPIQTTSIKSDDQLLQRLQEHLHPKNGVGSFYLIERRESDTSFVALNPVSARLEKFPSTAIYEKFIDTYYNWPLDEPSETFAPTEEVVLQKIMAMNDQQGNMTYSLVTNNAIEPLDCKDLHEALRHVQKEYAFSTICVENQSSTIPGAITQGELYILDKGKELTSKLSYQSEEQLIEQIKHSIDCREKTKFSTFTLENISSGETAYCQEDEAMKVVKYPSQAYLIQKENIKDDLKEHIEPILVQYVSNDARGLVHTYDPLQNRVRSFANMELYQQYLIQDLKNEAQSLAPNLRFINIRQVPLSELTKSQKTEGRSDWIALDTNTYINTTQEFLRIASQDKPVTTGNSKSWGIRFLHNNQKKELVTDVNGQTRPFQDSIDKHFYLDAKRWFRPGEWLIHWLNFSGMMFDTVNSFKQNVENVNKFRKIAAEQKQIPQLIAQAHKTLEDFGKTLDQVKMDTSEGSKSVLVGLENMYEAAKQEIHTKLTNLESAKFATMGGEKPSLHEDLQKQMETLNLGFSRAHMHHFLHELNVSISDPLDSLAIMSSKSLCNEDSTCRAMLEEATTSYEQAMHDLESTITKSTDSKLTQGMKETLANKVRSYKISEKIEAVQAYIEERVLENKTHVDAITKEATTQLLHTSEELAKLTVSAVCIADHECQNLLQQAQKLYEIKNQEVTKELEALQTPKKWMDEHTKKATSQSLSGKVDTVNKKLSDIRNKIESIEQQKFQQAKESIETIEASFATPYADLQAFKGKNYYEIDTQQVQAIESEYAQILEQFFTKVNDNTNPLSEIQKNTLVVETKAKIQKNQEIFNSLKSEINKKIIETEKNKYILETEIQTNLTSPLEELSELQNQDICRTDTKCKSLLHEAQEKVRELQNLSKQNRFISTDEKNRIAKEIASKTAAIKEKIGAIKNSIVELTTLSPASTNIKLKNLVEWQSKWYKPQCEQNMQKFAQMLRDNNFTESQIQEFLHLGTPERISQLGGVQQLFSNIEPKVLAEYAALKNSNGSFAFPDINSLVDYVFSFQIYTETAQPTGREDLYIDLNSKSVIEALGYAKERIQKGTVQTFSFIQAVEKRYGEWDPNNRELCINSIIQAESASVSKNQIKGRALIIDGTSPIDPAFQAHPAQPTTRGLSPATGLANIKNFLTMAKMYKTDYKIAASAQEFKDIVRQAAKEGPIDVIMLRGHGSQDSIEIGKDNITDLTGLENVVPKTTFLLESCSLGQGSYQQMNFVNRMANLMPESKIYAATEKALGGGMTIQADAQNEGLVAAQTGYLHGNDITYEISQARQKELCQPNGHSVRPLENWCKYHETKGATGYFW